jgi:hypothetical protein
MLKKLYLKYLKKLLIFSIIILFIEIVAKRYFPDIFSSFTAYLVLFFVAVTAFSHFIVLKTDVKRMEFTPDLSKTKEEQMKDLLVIERKFISNYLLTTMVKLLLFLAILLIYILVYKHEIWVFSLNFLALYLLFSVFEIIILKRPIHKNKK